jgi:hypothetical protein
VLSKTKLINALFLLGFTFYGIGNYLLNKRTYSEGVLFSAIPYLAIVLIFLLDLIYKRRFTPMVNTNFKLVLGFITFMVIGMWVGLRRGYQGLGPLNVSTTSVLYVVPFCAAVIVHVYNRENDDFKWGRMIMQSIALFLGANVLGMLAGIPNLIHGFFGRMDFPFSMGIYTNAHAFALFALAMTFYIRDFAKRPLNFLLMAGVFMACLVVIADLNSRLSTMIFFVFLLLFTTHSIKAAKGLYTISLFTMPLLVSFSLLVYQVISQPLFANLLGRVSKEDVTTFNGRTYIWEAIGEWAIYDRRGLLFGNGHMGQDKLDLLLHMEDLGWGNPSVIHLHSTFLEVLVDQGLIALILLYFIVYKGFVYYREQYRLRSEEAPLFAIFCYLLFIWQIDIFCYGMDLGYPLLMILLSPLCVDTKWVTRKKRTLSGELLVEEQI